MSETQTQTHRHTHKHTRLQVCSAMVHLSERMVVHRDLAARNVLVFEKSAAHWLVKLADFGRECVCGDSNAPTLTDPSNTHSVAGV